PKWRRLRPGRARRRGSKDQYPHLKSHKGRTWIIPGAALLFSRTMGRDVTMWMGGPDGLAIRSGGSYLVVTGCPPPLSLLVTTGKVTTWLRTSLLSPPPIPTFASRTPIKPRVIVYVGRPRLPPSGARSRASPWTPPLRFTTWVSPPFSASTARTRIVTHWPRSSSSPR